MCRLDWFMLLDNNPYVRYVPGGKQRISRLCTVHSISCSLNATRNQLPTRNPCNAVLKREWWLSTSNLQVINLLATRRLSAPIWQVPTLGGTILYLLIGSHSRLKFFEGRSGKDFGWWDEGRGTTAFLLDMWCEEEYSVCFLLFFSMACWIRVRVTDFFGDSSKGLFMSVVSWGRLQKSYHPMKHVAIFDSEDLGSLVAVNITMTSIADLWGVKLAICIRHSGNRYVDWFADGLVLDTNYRAADLRSIDRGFYEWTDRKMGRSNLSC